MSHEARAGRASRGVWRALLAAGLVGSGLLADSGGVGATPAWSVWAKRTSPPTAISRGVAGAPAATLKIGSYDAADLWSSGDEVRVLLDSSDGAGNCTGVGEFVSFSSVPNVTNSGTARFVTSIEESAPCAGLPGTTNDVLLIEVTDEGTGIFDVSGVELAAGADTPVGMTQYAVVTSAGVEVEYSPAPPAHGLAFIEAVSIKANDPPLGGTRGNGFQAPAPIAVTETFATAADGANWCLTLGGGNAFDLEGVAPTVTVSGAGSGDVVSNVTRTSTTLSFDVVAGPVAAASTFIIEGLRTSRTDIGPDFVTLGLGGCPGTQVSRPTTIGSVMELWRFAGASRYDTAAAAFLDRWANCGGGATAVIVTGEDFPDALTATYLASHLGTGVLLVQSNAVPASVLDVLRETGIDSVHIVGGPSAISQAVEDQLRSTPNYSDGGCRGGNVLYGQPDIGPRGSVEVDAFGVPLKLEVTRISGSTRYETMRNVAAYPGPDAVGAADYDGTVLDPDGAACEPRRTAVVATGEDYPDALVAGGFATPHGTPCGPGPGFPVLLTPRAALGGDARQALLDLGVQQVIVAGGTSAVSDAVTTAIQAMGIDVRRIGGATRFETAVALSTFKGQFLPDLWGAVLLVRGDHFADALSAPAHFTSGTNIVLSESPTVLGAASAEYLASHDNIFPWCYTEAGFGLCPIVVMEVFGGPAAISDGVLQEALNLGSLVESPR